MEQNKRAMVTTSLSWMIMAIIGVFFIVFAYSVINNYQNIEEEKFSLELQSTLNHVFTLIGQSTGSETNSLQKLNTIFQDRRVEMFCREGQPSLAIDGKENPNSDVLANYPTFMSVIEQRKVDESYIAVENFNLPFRATPLLGIVSKKNLFVIDTSNEELADIFREKFNEFSSFNELSVEFVDFSDNSEINTLQEDVQEQNLNSISFLSSEDEDYSDTINRFLDEISFYGTSIKVDYEEFLIDDSPHYNGTIRFANSTEGVDSQKYSFIDWRAEQFALPTMALFSKPESFECSYSILQEAINQSYYYYQLKSQELENFSQNNQHCREDIGTYEQQLKYQRINETLYEARQSETFINFKNTNLLEDLISNHNSIVEDSCIYLY